jgi:hypothetical protein
MRLFIIGRRTYLSPWYPAQHDCCFPQVAHLAFVSTLPDDHNAHNDAARATSGDRHSPWARPRRQAPLLWSRCPPKDFQSPIDCPKLMANRPRNLGHSLDYPCRPSVLPPNSPFIPERWSYSHPGRWSRASGERSSQ